MREVLIAKLAEPGLVVTFTDGEADTQLQRHNDALVIVAGIDHVPTHRILVDGERSANDLPLGVSQPPDRFLR